MVFLATDQRVSSMLVSLRDVCLCECAWSGTSREITGLAFCSPLAEQNPDGPGSSEGGILESQLQDCCAWNPSFAIIPLCLCSDLHPDPDPHFSGTLDRAGLLSLLRELWPCVPQKASSLVACLLATNAEQGLDRLLLIQQILAFHWGANNLLMIPALESPVWEAPSRA